MTPSKTPEREALAPLRISIADCPRCGLEGHHKIPFYKMHGPVVLEDGTQWTHFAMCPENNEPILWRVMTDGDQSAVTH